MLPLPILTMRLLIIPLCLILAGCATQQGAYFPPVEYVTSAEFTDLTSQDVRFRTVSARDEASPIAKPSPITPRPMAATPLVLIRVETNSYQPEALSLSGTTWWTDHHGAMHVVTNGKVPRITSTQYVFGIVTNGATVELLTLQVP